MGWQEDWVKRDEVEFVSKSKENLMMMLAWKVAHVPGPLNTFRRFAGVKEKRNLSSQEFFGLTEEELAQAVKLECKTAISIFLWYFRFCMEKQQRENLSPHGMFDSYLHRCGMGHTGTYFNAIDVFGYIKEAMEVGKVGFGDLSISEDEFKELKNKIYFILAWELTKYDAEWARNDLDKILCEVGVPAHEFLKCSEDEWKKVMKKRRR